MANEQENIATNEDITARYLSVEDLKIAASLLYQSYHDDPVFMDIFASEKEDYEQRLRAAIREELNAFWQTKQPMIGLFLNETMVGVACINSPDERIDSRRFWHWRLKMLLTAGYLSTKQLMAKEEKVIAAIPYEHFHLLSFIAIHPLHQHHGFGHYLAAAVNQVLEEHKESEALVVFATNEKYQAFFSDVGYETINELTIGRVSGSLMVHHKT